MLEIRNVTKIYRSKTGDSVKALDNVSISFPESGMVFLLGKSGSGKSTLLNVIGGLDSCDNGEFIIKGKSSKDFRGSDFDAYRNTFIGFIFQEYNVLDDFSVGANIGLALELQGKKATNDKINAILAEVDLENYAKRKPNELSGGQKQRVAIARALVKDPEIIMADEPTGALDSNTGKQIFDTLKKLSREKLVLVVSHDRDFAEKYADRIIELSDGTVISDVTKHERPGERLSDGIDRISHNLFKINRGYKLTEEDIHVINKYISENDCDIILSGDGRVNQELRSAAGITDNGGTTVFEDTDAEKDIDLKEYDGKKTGFIHSRLPLKNALRIGSSGLKHKKFRLAMTIILSTIAFALFGLSDTMAAYNKIQSATDSLIDSNVKYASYSLGVAGYYFFDGEQQDKYFSKDAMNDEDIKKLSSLTGLNFIPVFTGAADEWNGGFSVAGNYISFSSNQVFNGKLTGVISIESDTLEAAGLTLAAGRLPNKKGEIVIPELTYRSFKEYGFNNDEYDEEIKAEKISSYSDIIGKHITLNSSMSGENMTYEIVGILDTSFDYDRYSSFLPSDKPSEGGIADMVLMSELETDLKYGFHALAILSPDDIDHMIKSTPVKYEEYGEYMQGFNSETYIKFYVINEDGKEQYSQIFHHLGTDELISKLDIMWIGNEKASLEANEVLLPMSFLGYIMQSNIEMTYDVEEFKTYIDEIYGNGAYDKAMKDEFSTYMSVAENAAWEYYSSHNIYEYNVRADMLPFVIENIYGISDLIPNISNLSNYETILRFADILYNIQISSPMTYIYINELSNLVCNAYDIADLASSGLISDIKFMESVREHFGFESSDWDKWSDSEKLNWAAEYYVYNYKYNDQGYMSYDQNDIYYKVLSSALDMSNSDLDSMLSDLSFDRMLRNHELGTESVAKSYSFNVVGFIEETNFGNTNELIISNTLYNDYKEWYENEKEEYGFGDMMSSWVEAEHEGGIWAFALAPIGDDPQLIEKLVKISYDNSGDIKFELENSIMSTLNSFNDFIEIGAKVFLYVGIGFAVFSALLLMNFIATSISYKKREIGILRAVGARSSDVFKIFFSEALMIAIINFILSTATVIAATIGINTAMRDEGIRITLLNFGIRQIALMLLISVAVALIASFLPVNKTARRKPVDAIKNR